jgi:1,4-alpha-glucan branching enzyme
MMTAPNLKPAEIRELSRVSRGDHEDPHALLGPHVWGEGVTVRVLAPGATGVTVRGAWGEARLECEYRDVWAGVLSAGVGTDGVVPRYEAVVEHFDEQVVLDDPYRFGPTISDFDLHLISEGRHELLWTKLGAHGRELDGVQGTSFSVWAPSARGVRVAPASGPRRAPALPMRRLGASGVWDLFVPGLGAATRYQYEILGADGVWRDKADPLAFSADAARDAHSIVHGSDYRWGDGAWMADRSRRMDSPAPMSIYELHVGSWRRGSDWTALADQLPGYLTDLGFTHVELMPVMEHPYEGSWGYQVTSYYAPDSRRGDPDGLRLLVDRLHQAGIGVLLDWVPAHFAVDDWSLCRFDGTPLYEDPEPWRGWHPEWQTYIFNFGRPQVRNFLYANALYWLAEFHADGLRVDAVSSMLYLDYARPYGGWFPNRFGGNENLEAVWFLQELNATVSRRIPGTLLIAEESTAWPGVTRPTGDWGLGFDLKWNMGWMHDTLNYLRREPHQRPGHRDELLHTLTFAWAEHHVLPLSHDEVVHGKGSLLAKMPGDRDERFAGLRAYLALMWAYPGKKLLFMGDELAQPHEWKDLAELDWGLLADSDHAGVQTLVRDLNHLYADVPALWSRDNDPDASAWLPEVDAGSCVFALRRQGADGSALVCITNFAGNACADYRLPLPSAGEWEVVLNTDSWRYHQSWEPAGYRVRAVEEPDGALPASLRITLPALTTVWLRPVSGS